MTLPDPDQSRAVLVGVSNYSAMPKLPAVHNNVEALRYSLTGPASWNLPFQHCISVHDPKNTEELVEPILESTRAATDTLLVYYAGHGIKGPNRGELRLTTTSSRPSAPYTATLYDDIRDILLTSSAKRRIVILDCCYAGSALGIMADPGESLAEYALVEGTYLIAAAGETQAAKADGENGFTAFTGELINVFRNGAQDTRLALLDLDTVFNQLVQSLRAKSLPIPQRRVRNSPGSLAIAWNRQWMEQQLNNTSTGSAILGQTFAASAATFRTLQHLPSPPSVEATRANDNRITEQPVLQLPESIKTQSTPKNSGHELWPTILEEVKAYRRFTWILLSQNVAFMDLDEGKIRLGFINQGSLDNYLSSGSESVLKRALSEKMGLECEIHATVSDLAPTVENQGVAQPARPKESHIKTLTVGDEIDHDMFGRGVVLSAKGDGNSAEATVDFRDGGKPKRLLLKYTPFTKAEKGK